MQIDDGRIRLISEWAANHRAIKAVWLFGSRSRDQARPDSDYDLALELMPMSADGDDRPFTDFFFSSKKWKAELKALVRGDVSLIPYREGWDEKFNPCVVCLWSRE